MKLKLPKLSIFLKLVLTVLVFGLLLNVCVIIVFRLTADDKPRKYLRDFMRKMEKSIVYDIGIPPDTVKAQQICDDLEIEMRFESPAKMWTTSTDIPPLGELLMDPDVRRRYNEDETIIVDHKGKPYSVIRYPQGVFIIKPFAPDFFKPEKAVALLILFISVIIILLYLLLRKLFKPLKQLSAAVQQIGDGNYNIKLPVERQDELGELAGSINEMSKKINSSLKAKEQLLIDVSHELRSPLTRIKLGLEIDSSKEKIEEDVNEMERMVTSLLENYRADTTMATLKLERIEITSLMEDTIAEYSDYERIMFEKTDDEYYLNADFEKLQIVFRNLIDNSLKYSTGIINVSITEKHGEVLISVKDNGTGISEKDLDYIFEPFYRADRSRSRRTGGFGLGLSICKKIMDAHKAEIKIISKVNEGTEVILKFKSIGK
jgi:signal transduction histidine kinase